MPPMLPRCLLILSTLPLLSACGDNFADRAVSGAAIGALAGAAIGLSVNSHNTGRGALIGGAGGLVAGAVTPAAHLDLGTPVWRMQF